MRMRSRRTTTATPAAEAPSRTPRGCHGRSDAAPAPRDRRRGGGHQPRAPQLRPAGQEERLDGSRHVPAPRRPPRVRGEPGGVRRQRDAGGGGAAPAQRALRFRCQRRVRRRALPLRHRPHEGRSRAGGGAAQLRARQERGLGVG